jgi:hypothetical protein
MRTEQTKESPAVAGGAAVEVGRGMQSTHSDSVAQQTGEVKGCLNCGAVEDLVTDRSWLGGHGWVFGRYCRDRLVCAERADARYARRVQND